VTHHRILVVDDEYGMLEVCRDTLAVIDGAHIETVADPRRGQELIRSETWDLLVLDIKMPEIGGVELLRLAKETQPEVAVLIITAFPTVETAVEAMKLGATDYVTKPFIPDDLLVKATRALEAQRLLQENRFLAIQAEGPARFDDLIGSTAAMQELYDAINRVAPTREDILITGESGTGKELVARSLHCRSGRTGRFVPIDCGAIPDNLFESELFGHERGAFTSATARSPGLLEFADRGTLFLDEIGELPPKLQAKLLRVLQERSFRRVGGRDLIVVDVRVIAATNRDLRKEVAGGRFREDLYYRLNVVPLHLPPLRDRREDIPALFLHFLSRFGARREPPVLRADDALVEILQRYDWPGNVRELQSAVRRMVALSVGECLVVDDLPEEIALAPSLGPGEAEDGRPGEPAESFFKIRDRKMEEFERDYLARSLACHDGAVSVAADAAGIPRGTFYRLLKKHGLVASDYRGSRERGD
jgi:two-component system response regulator PilR (NtrC family)